MDRPAPPPLPRLDPTDHAQGNIFARILEAARQAREARYAYHQDFRDEHRARYTEEGVADASPQEG